MTNLDSILKNKDITLLTKVHKAMVFPVVIIQFTNFYSHKLYSLDRIEGKLQADLQICGGGVHCSVAKS